MDSLLCKVLFDNLPNRDKQNLYFQIDVTRIFVACMYPTALRRALGALRDAPPPIPVLPQKPLPVKNSALKVRKSLEKTIPKNSRNVGKFERSMERQVFAPGHERHNPAQRGRIGLLWRVRTLINEHFGSTYRVDTFGSSKYGGVLPNSDMDLIVLDNSRRLGFDPVDKKLPKIYNMRRLASALRKGGFIRVKAIPSATVPIVKFQDKETGIECDINVNEQPGYWNSVMIREYGKLSPYLIPLLKAIKLWAKPLGLNSPSPEKPRQLVTFSSYSYALMTIAFLQREQLLPNLQANLDGMQKHLFMNRKPLHLCDLRFNSKGSPMPGNDSTNLIALMAAWFEFWGSFDPTQHMVDIRLGGILPRIMAPLDSEPLRQETQVEVKVLESEDLIPSPLNQPDQEIPPEFPSQKGGLKNTEASETSLALDQEPFKPTSSVHMDELPYNPQALQRWEHHTFCLIDPFIRIRNVGTNITGGVFEHFQEECRRARAELRRRQF
ncbi:hypothetical protein D9756_007303 [Leucocoprinus leucothites]|uniref:Poly(A) RNA polymerase mitochondrial-like central palm domain-containing protein n=1 Tax=Leucocoprinus leucothites TaxID=201217 RepID=A0A8H5D663_9AGAR|nr:hypothetical protein D9756_007303 [Leucoagaricus leucothites]